MGELRTGPGKSHNLIQCYLVPKVINPKIPREITPVPIRAVMFYLIKEDIQTALKTDPAARNVLEVILCYPGFHAVTIHRLAHWLWKYKFLLLGRLVSHINRFLTGIEIHPGATLGRRLFIDHGMGVVIGETTIVGDDVVLYQGVTLGGGAAARQGEQTRNTKRHPTLGNNVVVGSGAEIQGDIKIGNNVMVASGSIVLNDIPEHSVVVGVPGRVIYHQGKKVKLPDPKDLPDTMQNLKQQVLKLEKQLLILQLKVNAPATSSQGTITGSQPGWKGSKHSES